MVCVAAITNGDAVPDPAVIDSRLHLRPQTIPKSRRDGMQDVPIVLPVGELEAILIVCHVQAEGVYLLGGRPHPHARNEGDGGVGIADRDATDGEAAHSCQDRDGPTLPHNSSLADRVWPRPL